jgi:carboxypeptidase D
VFVFVREFVLGSNTTGLVDVNTGSVVGGEESALVVDAMPEGTVIFYGNGDSATTTLSTIAPSATLTSWAQFLATATATASPGASGSKSAGDKNAAVPVESSLLHVCTGVGVGIAIILI